MVAALPNERPAAAAQAAEAAHRLFVQYAGPLRRYCRGQLPSLEEAEDAVQTTFLRAYNALSQGVVPQYEAAWLYKIAHNVCLSRRLAATRRARVETPRDLELLQDEVGAPQRSHEELMGLDDALAKMPEKLRTPFLMREWQGLSYHEIAAELGVSHSAVETLIFRARKHLAGALEGTLRQRARRARAAFDVGGLLAGLKAFFGGGSAALQAAAAVAALAVGTGTAARALAGNEEPPLRSQAQAFFAQLSAPPVVQELQEAVAPKRAAAKIAPEAAAGPATVVAARVTGGRPAPVESDVATAPGVEPAPAVVPVAEPPVQAAAPEQAPPAPSSPSRPAAAQPSPAPPVAKTPEAPAQPKPVVATPTVPAVPSVPSPTVPSVTVPSQTTPEATVPQATVPQVTVPAVTTPVATTPPVTTPAVTTPQVTVPPVTTPAATTPAVTTPAVPKDVPKDLPPVPPVPTVPKLP
jgi:RNA polymerase sigma factor (sigma-70 family)